MKYAFYPGCVSRGGTPELYTSTMAIAGKLGLELEEILGASCTGAGVLQEKGLKLGDTLNARTFAMAERMGLHHDPQHLLDLSGRDGAGQLPASRRP